MDDYGRRIVIDLNFDQALAEAIQALQKEGMEVIARIDVREHFRQRLQHDFRRYILLQVWLPEMILGALRDDLRAGAILPTTVAVYELADGETAVVASEPLAPILSDLASRREMPGLAAVGDEESERIARALARLQRRTSQQTPGSATAYVHANS